MRWDGLLEHWITGVVRHDSAAAVEAAVPDPAGQVRDRGHGGVVGDCRGLRDRIHLNAVHTRAAAQHLLRASLTACPLNSGNVDYCRAGRVGHIAERTPLGRPFLVHNHIVITSGRIQVSDNVAGIEIVNGDRVCTDSFF